MKAMKSQMLVALISLLLWGVSFLQAGILNVADPTPNQSAPTGDYADSGWQYTGQWGGGSEYVISAVIVSPTQILTAKHYGSTTNAKDWTFRYDGQTYYVKDKSTANVNDHTSWNGTSSDLRLVTLEGANFTAAQIAPIYTGATSGKTAVIVSNGQATGTGVTGGWEPAGTGSATQDFQWGTNVIEAAVPTALNGSPVGTNQVISWDFDNTGKTDYEIGLADKDSGGGVFVENAEGEWSLTGVNYGTANYWEDKQSGNNYNEYWTNPIFSETGSSDDEFMSGGMYDASGWYFKNGTDWLEIADQDRSKTWSFATDLTATDNATWLTANIVPVPEPATMSLLALGGIAMLRRRRK
ncbi:MAG: PEP-CTERM sorting domain-containing protein [Phycisphaerales bacterium]|jgi:hypothetical protein|nr:PEP-CTERM sorting domain-containing protein [Phycisphaerales bacterium]